MYVKIIVNQKYIRGEHISPCTPIVKQLTSFVRFALIKEKNILQTVLHRITINMLAEERGQIIKLATIRLDDKNLDRIKDISKLFGEVTTQSDIIRFCIWYTWTHKANRKYSDI